MPEGGIHAKCMAARRAKFLQKNCFVMAGFCDLGHSFGNFAQTEIIGKKKAGILAGLSSPHRLGDSEVMSFPWVR